MEDRLEREEKEKTEERDVGGWVYFVINKKNTKKMIVIIQIYKKKLWRQKWHKQATKLMKQKITQKKD